MRRSLVQVAIVVHIAATILISFPRPPAGLNRLRDWAQPWIGTFQLGQNWTMFSPNVPTRNARIEAEVELADGTRINHFFPLPESMGLVERYARERWRKLVQDNAAKLPVVRRLLADYVMRLYDRPEMPVARVTFVSRWGAIPPPVGTIAPARLPAWVPRESARYPEREVVYVGEFRRKVDERGRERW